MQRSFDAGPVIVAEDADALHDILDIFFADRVRGQQHLAPGQARFWLTAQVHDDLEQLLAFLHCLKRIADMRRQHLEQLIQIVGDQLRCTRQAHQAWIFGTVHDHRTTLQPRLR